MVRLWPHPVDLFVEPLAERADPCGLCHGRAGLPVAGRRAGEIGQLDRAFRRPSPQRGRARRRYARACPRSRRRAAPAGAVGGASGSARAGGGRDLDRIVALDPGIGGDAHRRGARYYPIPCEPADFPWTSWHVLRACHHGSGGRRHHPRAGAQGWRNRDRGLQQADDRAGIAAWRHGDGVLKLASGAGGVAGRGPAGTVRDPWPEPLLSRA